MELHEIERDIEALKSSPLVLVCRTPQGRVKAMSLQKCVETGSSFLYVAVDELDALLDHKRNGLKPQLFHMLFDIRFSMISRHSKWDMP